MIPSSLIRYDHHPAQVLARELAQATRVPSAPTRRHARIRALLRFAVRRASQSPVPVAHAVTIRTANDGDRVALQRLAALDERPLPSGAALVAEVDREIVASVSLETGEPISDPFRAGRDVVVLLELRAAQLAA